MRNERCPVNGQPPAGRTLTPVLALLAQHAAVVAWNMAPWLELNVAAEFMAVTLTVVVVVLLRRWSRARLAARLGAAVRDLLALAVAVVVMAGNVLLAVVVAQSLLWVMVR